MGRNETDEEMRQRLEGLSNRELARRLHEGGSRERNIIAQVATDQGKKKAIEREVENLAIGSGAAPRSLLRRITGW